MGEEQQIPNLVSLQGRQALVTGAAAGIGKAIALRFAEAGADLDLVDVNQPGLEKVQGELAVYGVRVRTHVVDLADEASRDGLWTILSDRTPDILVNNAGIYPFREFLRMDEKLYHKVIATNLDSVYWMCHHMISQRKRRGGVILNVSSIEAILPFKEDLAHYSMSKAGVIGLTRALAKEHGRHGFRVNAILPGGILTQGTRAAARGIFRLEFNLLKTGWEFMQRLPIGRMGRADEVARMALVLVSDMASYVHGAIIPIDGGFLAA